MFKSNLMLFIDHLLKHLVSCFALIIGSLLLASLSGCHRSPHYSSAIMGDIKVSTNTENNLCFEPLFATTTQHSKPIKIKHIKMTRLDLDSTNVPIDESSTIRTIIPLKNKYHIIENGQNICLDNDNPNVKQNIYKPLKPQALKVSIKGINDRKEEFVFFYHNFEYPYISDESKLD